jgi:threonine dehydratase
VPGPLVISSAVFLFFGAPAHSFELNGAWANDPSICDKIFVKQNAKLAMTKDADNYGSGFIVEGNQVRGKIASCNIKSRKEDAGLVRPFDHVVLHGRGAAGCANEFQDRQ